MKLRNLCVISSWLALTVSSATQAKAPTVPGKCQVTKSTDPSGQEFITSFKLGEGATGFRYDSSRKDFATVDLNTGKLKTKAIGQTVISAIQMVGAEPVGDKLFCSLEVVRIPLTLPRQPPMTANIGASNLLALTTPSKGWVTYTVAEQDARKATIKGNRITLYDAGKIMVIAEQTADNYYTAARTTIEIKGNKIAQAIIFEEPTRQTDGRFFIEVKASSNEAVQLTSETPDACKVENRFVSLLSDQTCRLHAKQSGSKKYLDVSSTKSFSIEDEAIISNSTHSICGVSKPLGSCVNTINVSRTQISNTASSPNNLALQPGEQVYITYRVPVGGQLWINGKIFHQYMPAALNHISDIRLGSVFSKPKPKSFQKQMVFKTADGAEIEYEGGEGCQETLEGFAGHLAISSSWACGGNAINISSVLKNGANHIELACVAEGLSGTCSSTVYTKKQQKVMRGL